MARFLPENKVTCPHCGVAVKLVAAETFNVSAANGLSIPDAFRVDHAVPTLLLLSRCPACDRSIIQAVHHGVEFFVAPRVPFRRALHGDVPAPLREDFNQALLVLHDSPMASAALSRRCLQTLLALQGAKTKDLIDQIAEIEPQLPSYVQSSMDHIRQLGNISAHAKQSKATGEIVSVEPGEADWMLQLLEDLFDHFYTKPSEAKAKKAALDAKFADAGKLKLWAAQVLDSEDPAALLQL